MGIRSNWFNNMRLANQLQLAGLALLVVFALTVAFDPSTRVLQQALLFCASLAFTSGFVVWFWPAFSNVWGCHFGKLLVLTLHVFVLLFAAVLSRNVVASALGLPPQDFDITVSLVAIAFYVPAWSLVVSILGGAIAFILYAYGLLIGLLRRPFGESAKLFGHSAGALAICFYSGAVFDFSSKHEKSLHPLVKWVALFSDFQNAKLYPGVAANERVRLHENGVVSSASVENNTVVIHVRKYEP